MLLWKVRYHQIRRDLSWMFFVLVLLTGSLFEFLFNYSTADTTAVTGAIALLLLLIHNNRNDLRFLFKHAPVAQLQLTLEYQAFLLPFTLPALWGKAWLYGILLHLFALLLVCFKPPQRERLRYRFLGEKIPALHFEWIAGIRSSFVWLSLLLLITLLLSPVKLFPLFGIWLVAGLIQNFYSQNESIQMLNASGMRINEFLHKKAAFASWMVLLFSLPTLLINMLFQADSLIMDVLFLLYLCTAIATVVFIKYYFYFPKSKANGTIASLLLVNAVIFFPYLLPLLFLFAYMQYKKARTHLMPYSYD